MTSRRAREELLVAAHHVILKAATDALAILDGLSGGDPPSHVWFEMGRASITLRLALPGPVRLPGQGNAPGQGNSPQTTEAHHE